MGQCNSVAGKGRPNSVASRVASLKSKFESTSTALESLLADETTTTSYSTVSRRTGELEFSCFVKQETQRKERQQIVKTHQALDRLCGAAQELLDDHIWCASKTHSELQELIDRIREYLSTCESRYSAAVAVRVQYKRTKTHVTSKDTNFDILWDALESAEQSNLPEVYCPPRRVNETDSVPVEVVGVLRFDKLSEGRERSLVRLPSGVFCQERGKDNNYVEREKDEILLSEGHRVFFSCGCVGGSEETQEGGWQVTRENSSTCRCRWVRAANHPGAVRVSASRALYNFITRERRPFCIGSNNGSAVVVASVGQFCEGPHDLERPKHQFLASDLVVEALETHPMWPFVSFSEGSQMALVMKSEAFALNVKDVRSREGREGFVRLFGSLWGEEIKKERETRGGIKREILSLD
uniref:Uncharacterized protein n=1 Tax=Chromera velia CCMP2878 TaxID=1169474 RepID=A0A0G4FB66_9ALVE|eukprot:Cvel_16098.t1-p1 / transcript=Cvel_16098.t1 / gene=Cvel_16098 / organism=Chromera_velia_CCMP2878 / gene_product=hypothetical protein / transcript_product=hypothetical protein / location=Cvel_scaffold1225:5257-7029(-) / protein_length=410 / sequence_SO=supercontig / SO=protein_coding / is_pseudo=false